VIRPPDMINPFAGAWNEAFPVPDGGVAGSFVAFGWFRQLWNEAVPSYVSDMVHYEQVQPGGFL
jgi:hypothetical protein